MKAIKTGLFLMSVSILFPLTTSAKEIKKWDPQLIAIVIAWHKEQYLMFERFMNYEDTLVMKNEQYQVKAEDFREVDETLFNQLKDIKISNTFLALDMIEAAAIFNDIINCSSSTLKMIWQPPYNSECEKVALEIQLNILGRFKTLSSVIIQKAIKTDNENLADNKVRNDLTKYVISELQEIRKCNDECYRILETAKMSVVMRTPFELLN